MRIVMTRDGEKLWEAKDGTLLFYDKSYKKYFQIKQR